MRPILAAGSGCIKAAISVLLKAVGACKTLDSLAASKVSGPESLLPRP